MISDQMYQVLDILLMFGVPMAFLLWHLRSVTNDIRKRKAREAKEAREAETVAAMQQEAVASTEDSGAKTSASAS